MAAPLDRGLAAVRAIVEIEPVANLLQRCTVQVSAVEALRSVARCGWEGRIRAEGWSGPGRRCCATDGPGVVRTARGGAHGVFAAATSAVVQAMTTEIPGNRRRAAVSVTSSDPISQLSRAVETFHRVNRTLPSVPLSREELIALGGLLTQISGALMTLTDLLSAPAHRCDRPVLPRANSGATRVVRPPAAPRLLRNCRDGYLAAYAHARAFHDYLRRRPRT